MSTLAGMSALGERTLATLWERSRQQGDMPGFAKAITAILGAMRGEDDKEFDMARTVLSDPVLTQKVLRLANSGMYSAFGQQINTVSKAMLVLGTEAIGHLALGLKPTSKWKRPSWPAWSRAKWRQRRITATARKPWSVRCCTHWVACW
jgi:HD-like signal output (HDOD) protein